jgi:hypothetical protein
MAFYEHTGEITSPITAYPAKALAQILWAVFQSSLHLRLFMILHLDLPIMRIHPPGDEVIVIRVQLASTPLFVSETMGEVFSIEDCTSVGDCPAGKTGQASIDM